MKREEAYEVLAAGEMRRKYGLTAESESDSDSLGQRSIGRNINSLFGGR